MVYVKMVNYHVFQLFCSLFLLSILMNLKNKCVKSNGSENY